MDHFLFHCPLYDREAFRAQSLLATGMWPPLLSAIPQSPPLWAEMVTFITNSKILLFCRNQATRVSNYSSPPSTSSLSATALVPVITFPILLILPHLGSLKFPTSPLSLHASASQTEGRRIDDDRLSLCSRPYRRLPPRGGLEGLTMPGGRKNERVRVGRHS